MMVSPYDQSRLLLVLQIDHSRVAGYLAAHWGNEMFARPEPYESVVLAAQEHDNGWWEWEIKPGTLNDRGYPLDYHDGSLKYLGKLRLDFYKNAVDRIAEKDPYSGLVVLMHGVGLMNAGYGMFAYPPDRSSNPLVRDYIQGQEELRVKLLEDLRRSEAFCEFSADDYVWMNFKLMEIFDQLAQFLCNRYPLNSDKRRLGPSNTLNNVPAPKGAGRDEVVLTVDVKDAANAVVRPYPFDVDPLVISFPARLVSDRPYQSEGDFLENFYKAERTTISYTLHAN